MSNRLFEKSGALNNSFIYLFLAVLGLHSCMAFSNYRKWGLLSSCCVTVSYCGGFSCCRAWALGHTGSAAVEHRLSCSKVYGIFMDQGSKPYLLYWQMDSFPLSCWKPSATLSGRGFCYSILQVKKQRPVYSDNPQSFTKYYLELQSSLNWATRKKWKNDFLKFKLKYHRSIHLSKRSA